MVSPLMVGRRTQARDAMETRADGAVVLLGWPLTRRRINECR